jgi:hypothetical protein
MDYGITEFEFWDMTIDELIRAIESKQRIHKREMQEKATFDYMLADLIGRSIGRMYSSSATMPDIDKVYPYLFDDKQVEEAKQQKQDEASALNFKLFAESFNQKFKKKESDAIDE